MNRFYLLLAILLISCKASYDDNWCPTYGCESVETSSFTPSDISNLELWLDFGDSSLMTQDAGCTTGTIGAGDLVGCVRDKSGNNFHASNSGAASKRPTFSIGSFSGKNSLEFIRANLSRLTMNFSDLNEIYKSDNSLFVVYKAANTSNDQQVVSGRITAGPRWGISVKTLGSIDYYSGASLSPLNTTPTTLVENESLHSFIQEGTNLTAYSLGNNDGVQVITVGTTTLKKINIGCANDGDTHLDGNIAEVVVYSQALSLDNRQKVEGYLACKWNLQAELPVDHPYVESCPTI